MAKQVKAVKTAEQISAELIANSSAAEREAAKMTDTSLRAALDDMSNGFLYASRHVYRMCLRDDTNQPLYRALGYPTQRDYADALNTSYTEIKALDRVGRMLDYGHTGVFQNDVKWELWWDAKELTACGKASMIELARLAGSPQEYNENIDTIVRLILARANGKMTHKELKAEIDELMPKPAKATATAPAPAPAPETDPDGEGERIDMSGNVAAWKKALYKALGTAHTPAEALIVAQSIVEDYGDTGEVISITTASAAA